MRWDTTRDSKPSIFRSEKFWIVCIIIGIVGLMAVAAYNPSSSNQNTPSPVVCHAINGCFQGQLNSTGLWEFYGRTQNVTIDVGSNTSYVEVYSVNANYSGTVGFSFFSHDNSTQAISMIRVSDMNSTQYFTSTCFSAPSVPCLVGETYRYVVIGQPYVKFSFGHVYRIDVTCDLTIVSQFFRLSVS